MNNFINDFRSAEKLVKAVMRDYPETRGDDKKLMLKVWEIQGFRLSEEQKNAFNRCLPAETIRRSRQKWHEKGIYLPTKEVYEQRQLLSEEFREVMKNE